MTFPRIFARFKYWREFPPVHLLVRSLAVGFGAFKPDTHAAKTGEQFDYKSAFLTGVIG